MGLTNMTKMFKYIYLDWNVIQYMKSPRQEHKEMDAFFKELIFNLRKKYIFPYCEAHLKDLANGYSEKNAEYIKEDLNFITLISKNNVIGIQGKEDQFIIIEHDPFELFNRIIQKPKQSPYVDSKKNPNDCFIVDMDLIDKDNPLYEMLEQSNGLYNPEFASRWLESIQEDFFNSPQRYKKFREYVPKIKSAIKSNNTLNMNEKQLNYLSFLIPYLDLLSCEKEDLLENKFEEAVKVWLLIKYDNIYKIPMGEVISTGYSLLDMHPLFREKLKKNNKLSNITRDSKHIFYAYKAEYFVSEDTAALKKTKFLYKALNINTKVINMDEFIQRFS